MSDLLSHKNIKNGKVLLFFSIFLLLYFCALLLLSYFRIDTSTIGFIVELLTIPSIIILIVLFIGSLVTVISKKGQVKSNYSISLVILIVTILMLITGTIIE